MEFDFGTNLKELRKAKGFTQEDVAEFLNISKQSISRWENNVTYPDITILPTIASLFGTTVDSVLGADFNKNRQMIEAMLNRRHTAHHNGDIQSAYEISNKLITRFPCDLTILNCSMTDCYLMGFHNYDNKRKQYLNQSIEASKKLLKLSSDLEEMCRAIKNISVCCKLLGDENNAILWMNKLPTVWNCIENAILSIYDKNEEKSEAIKTSLDGIIHLLYRMIYALALEQPNDSDKIAILEKIPKLFELLFENSDYGFYNSFLSAVYYKIADLQNNEQLKNQYIQNALSCAKKYDETKPSIHSSLLFKNIPITPDEWTSATSESKYDELLKKINA